MNVLLEATLAIPGHGVPTLMVVSLASVMMAGKETARTATVTYISEAWAVKTNVNEILGKTGFIANFISIGSEALGCKVLT